MTQDDVKLLVAMKDEPLAALTVVELSALQKTMAERDAVIASAAEVATAHAAKYEEFVAQAKAKAKAEAEAEAAKHVAALADLQAAIKDRDAKLAEMQAYVDACGGTEMARKLQRQVKIEAARKAKADAEAALAALQP